MQSLFSHSMEPLAAGQTTSKLLPDNLRVFLRSRAPGNHLATSLSETLPVPEPQLPELASIWLTDEERQHLDRYSFSKRRTEWLSGRICAKRAVLDLLDGQTNGTVLRPLDIAIQVSPNGRPIAVIDPRIVAPPHLDISISHTHGTAIGIAGHGLCGVDIQYLSDTLFRVRSRYCDEIEVAILETVMESELAQLGMLWASKEAIRKCFSDITLLGFLDMRLERISTDQGYRLLTFHLAEPFSRLGSVSVTAHVHESCALAVCTVAGERLKHARIA